MISDLSQINKCSKTTIIAGLLLLKTQEIYCFYSITPFSSQSKLSILILLSKKLSQLALSEKAKTLPVSNCAVTHELLQAQTHTPPHALPHS